MNVEISLRLDRHSLKVIITVCVQVSSSTLCMLTQGRGKVQRYESDPYDSSTLPKSPNKNRLQ